MGFWSIFCGGKADEGKILSNRPSPPPDFDARANIGDARPIVVNPAASFNIVTPSGPKRQAGPSSAPLPYSIAIRPHSVQMLWPTLVHGLTIGNEYGIPGAFNVLRHRRFQVWIDDNSKLPATSKQSIRMTALILHLLGRAMDSDMEFFFMSHSNSDSNDLDEEEARKSKALDELWQTQSWNQAKTLVERSEVLQTMGLEDWINANSPPGEGIQRVARRREDPWSRTASHLPANSKPAKGEQGLDTETSQETFTRLLGHVRGLKVHFWRGFHQRSLDLDELRKKCIKATNESQKQPRSLSNVRFTLERATAHYRRQMKSQGGTPTTVLLLTGSPMQKSEVNLVIDQQKKSHQGGEGGDFFIEIVAWTKAMDHVGKQSFRVLDEAFKGTQDINDVTEVDDELLLGKGPSATLLLKMLNANNPAVDKMNLRKADLMYGNADLLGPGQTKLVMPSFEDVARALGQYQEPEAEEDDDAREEGPEGPEAPVPYAQAVAGGGPFGDSKRVAAAATRGDL